MNEILCHECGHSINEHITKFAHIGGKDYRTCKLTPQDIAAHAVAEARKELVQITNAARDVVENRCSRWANNKIHKYYRIEYKWIDGLAETLHASPCTPGEIGSDADYADFKRTENDNLASMR